MPSAADLREIVDAHQWYHTLELSPGVITRGWFDTRKLAKQLAFPDLHGMFDFVYVGSILLHLRDPVHALDRVRRVCRGDVLVVDAIDMSLTISLPWRAVALLDGKGRPWWWKPNVAGLVRMVEAAGFDVVGRPQRLAMPAGAGQPVPPLRPSVLRHPAGRNAAYIARRGDPHAAVVARPRAV